jgi:hypothetical protein
VGISRNGFRCRCGKVILNKCLKENKYFKVWRMSWKGDISDMPEDWWEGKFAYYKYKG